MNRTWLGLIVGWVLLPCLTGFETAPRAAGFRTEVQPSFFAGLQEPAFQVTCVNPTRTAIDVVQLQDGFDVMVDGAVLDPTSSPPAGTTGGMLLRPYQPGEAGSFVLVLHQDRAAIRSYPGPVQTGRFVPLTEGRHSVAFRCRDSEWSDTITFAWYRR